MYIYPSRKHGISSTGEAGRETDQYLVLYKVGVSKAHVILLRSGLDCVGSLKYSLEPDNRQYLHEN